MGFFISKLSTDVRTNLIGQWKFDETVGNTAIDNSGRGNNASLIGGPVRVNTLKDRGLKFSGSNQYTIISSTSKLALSNSLTISFWSRLGTTAGSRYVMTKRLGQDDYAIVFGFIAGKYELYGEFFTGTAPRTALTTSVVDTDWHLITFTYDGATVNGYLDGKLDVQSNKVFSFGDSGGALRFATSTGGVDFYNGTLNDVRLYNRPLTSQEVLTLYNIGKIKKG